MAKRITATAAAREFSHVLDRVEHGGDEFVVERHGRAVATIAPVTTARRAKWGDVVAVLDALPRPDAAFGRELKKARRDQPRLPRDPWASSSTRRS